MAKPVTRLQQGRIAGFQHEPEGTAWATLILTHGAGSNCESPLLVAVASNFCLAGMRVLRLDLAFRQKRPKGPPPPGSATQDRAGLREAVSMAREQWAGKIFLGGHSYGGRQASMLAAEEANTIDALLLLSYPLHPPAKPAELRTAHFPGLHTHAFFLHGTEDEFGTVEEMKAALALIPARTELKVLEKAGHELRRGRFDVGQELVREYCDWVGQKG